VGRAAWGVRCGHSHWCVGSESQRGAAQASPSPVQCRAYGGNAKHRCSPLQGLNGRRRAWWPGTSSLWLHQRRTPAARQGGHTVQRWHDMQCFTMAPCARSCMRLNTARTPALPLECLQLCHQSSPGRPCSPQGSHSRCRRACPQALMSRSLGQRGRQPTVSS